MLGVGFIRHVEQGGTLEELEGTKTQQMEYYVEVQGQGVEVYLLGEGCLGW